MIAKIVGIRPVRPSRVMDRATRARVRAAPRVARGIEVRDATIAEFLSVEGSEEYAHLVCAFLKRQAG